MTLRKTLLRYAGAATGRFIRTSDALALNQRIDDARAHCSSLQRYRYDRSETSFGLGINKTVLKVVGMTRCHSLAMTTALRIDVSER